MEPQLFTYTSSEANAVKALQEQMLGAIDEGAPAATVDIDGLAALDVASIRGLITLLRRVREAGGDMVLHATRPELLRTLGVTGLDRVFRVTSQVAA